jgi:hypothetical protein
MGFEALTSLDMKNSFFWDILSSNSLKVILRFGGLCRFHF